MRTKMHNLKTNILKDNKSNKSNFLVTNDLLKNIHKYSKNQHIITDNNFIVELTGNQHLELIKGFHFFDYLSHNSIEYPSAKIKTFINTDTQTCEFKFTYAKKHYNATITKLVSTCNELKKYFIEIEDITSTINRKQHIITIIENLTHDIKTPVSSEYKVLTQFAEQKYGSISELQNNVLTEILLAHTHLEQMLDNLLTSCKLEVDSFSINQLNTSYKNLLEKVANSLKYVLSNKEQTLKIEYLSKTSEVLVDNREINRVLINLVINASEHTKTGGTISIKVEDAQQGMLKTTISDNGCGISQDIISQLFCKNYIKAKKFRKVGTGLGLYISKSIIEAHKGTIILHSKQNQGTDICFTLPIVQPIRY